MGLGFGFKRLTRNMSDFVRGGAQGTWWLVGTRMLMSGISAFTFTGNGSAAFEAGPTFLIIYVANCVSYLIGWLFLGAWYRQTRAYTTADVLRARFGTAVEQLSVYTGLVLGPLAASIQLWALGMFTSAVFGFPLTTTIIVIGGVAVAYSTVGGKWAVMATDFVQGLVMMAITAIMSFLAIKHIGGTGGFIIIAAILLSLQKEIILFDAYLMIGSIIGLPLAFPKLMGLWVKRLTFFSYFIIFGACLIPSFISFYDSLVHDQSWIIQHRAMWIFISGIIATLICITLNRFENPRNRERINEFFKTMRTPVDFAKEIGESTDHQQAKIVGVSTLLIGLSSALLLFLPNPWSGRLWILLFSGTIGSIGLALIAYSRRDTKKPMKKPDSADSGPSDPGATSSP